MPFHSRSRAHYLLVECGRSHAAPRLIGLRAACASRRFQVGNARRRALLSSRLQAVAGGAHTARVATAGGNAPFQCFRLSKCSCVEPTAELQVFVRQIHVATCHRINLLSSSNCRLRQLQYLRCYVRLINQRCVLGLKVSGIILLKIFRMQDPSTLDHRKLKRV